MLDTCAAPRTYGAFSSEQDKLVPQLPNVGRFTLAASGTALSWTTNRVPAAGGVYRLCWCERYPLTQLASSATWCQISNLQEGSLWCICSAE